MYIFTFTLFFFFCVVVCVFVCIFFFLMIRRPPRSTRTDTLFPYTTFFRSIIESDRENSDWIECSGSEPVIEIGKERNGKGGVPQWLPTIARFDGYQFFRIEGSALHQRRISQLTVNPRGGADAP